VQLDPFLRFHRAAEGAAYPALLIVSFVSLALIVASIALLAVLQTAWVFALTLVSLAVASAAVAGATLAALSDSDEPAAGRTPAQATPDELGAPVPMQRRSPATSAPVPNRKAA
jgi:predicted ribosomally synthesized peptide with SipW-like signal peptide